MGAARRRGQPQFLPAGVPLRARTLAQCQGPHILSGRQPGGKGGAQAGRQAGRVGGGWGPLGPPHHTADTVTTSGLRGFRRRLLAKKARVAKLAESSSCRQAGAWTGRDSR